MASVRALFYLLSVLFVFSWLRSAATQQDRCGYKVVQSSVDEAGRRLGVIFRTDNCSVISPAGKHAIHEVSNMSFSHLSCSSQAAVIVHWYPSPLGIEHVKGFRVYLEDKNPEGKQCQHLVLKDPRQLNFSYRNTKLSSQLFSGLLFDTDYMVRVVPFPTFMNDSFFPPSFLRTNSCEVLLGPDNVVCKPFWRPRSLNVSQLGSSLHVMFDHAPTTFGVSIYFLFYKLRQEAVFRAQPCKPELNLYRTTCVLQDVSPGTYAIELRDDNNITRRQTQYHVSQVHSPWAGPIRAMAITVPLVLMSAFATLFTVMCRKKQQENIYSQLDEESSESSSHSAVLGAERPWPRPKVMVCYSNRDGPKHTAVIQSFAYFLQDFCGCEVVLDLWEHLEMCKEGQMSWLSRRLDESNYIITVCSKGLRYYVEKKNRRGKTPVSRRSNSSSVSPSGGLGNDQFIVAVAMIAEKLRLAKQSEGGGSQELSRYMAVYFDYSTENDVPTVLSLATRFKLMDQLPQLFSRLHSSQTSLSDRESQPVNVSRRNYFRSRSGRSLYVSICNMHQHIAHNPDWFNKHTPPAEGGPSTSSSLPPSPQTPDAPPKPTSSSSSSPAKERLESGLVLNEVVVRSASLGGDGGALRKNALLLTPGSSTGVGLGTSRSCGGECPSPSMPHCSTSAPAASSRRSSPGFAFRESSSSAPSIQDAVCGSSLRPSPPPPHLQSEGDPSSPTEAPPPRDSGIYDSSVPSSELSIPLMEGLSHDQADSSSLADSESSSSGLGDEEPPAVGSLHCGAATVCKVELHHQLPLQHGDRLTPVATL